MKRTCLGFFLALLVIISLSPRVMAEGDRVQQATMPKTYGKAAITIDIDTGEIIYANNIDAKEYPASTTKFLTALLLAENKDKADKLQYTKSAKSQPAYSLNINIHPIAIGDSFTAEGAMDALLIYSANDVAYMIADNIGGDSKKFAELMNERIAKLGLKNTHFTTPNGLHDDNHFTTAYDLSVIAREAFKNEWVRETMAKNKSRVETTSGITIFMENTNKLLEKDGCIGGKTGYTEKAGRCLVAFYERGGRKIVGVVMNSIWGDNDSYVFEDMKKIVDWSYSAKPSILHKKGETVETETIVYKPLKFFGPVKTVKIPLVINEEVLYFSNSINDAEKKENVAVDRINIWDLDKSKVIGTMSWREREASKQYNLYATISTNEILKQNIFLYIGAGIITFIFMLMMLVAAVKLNRFRRKKRYYSA